MPSLSAARGRQMHPPLVQRLIVAVAALSMCGWSATPVSAQDAASKADTRAGAEFREPVTLATIGGVVLIVAGCLYASPRQDKAEIQA